MFYVVKDNIYLDQPNFNYKATPMFFSHSVLMFYTNMMVSSV